MDEAELQGELEALREEVRALREKLTAMGDKETTFTFEEEKENSLYGRFRDLLEDQGCRIMEAIRNGFEKAGEPGRKALETVQSRIEERPIETLFVAFGVGLLIGKILDRNR